MDNKLNHADINLNSIVSGVTVVMLGLGTIQYISLEIKERQLEIYAGILYRYETLLQKSHNNAWIINSIMCHFCH